MILAKRCSSMDFTSRDGRNEWDLKLFGKQQENAEH